MRVVRSSLENPDAVTQSAVSAREHIGMAVADKIRQLESVDDLETVAEDILPQFEKFLESPEEKRLRRIRGGVVAAAVGLGGTIVTLLLAFDKSDFFPFVAPFLVTFLVGIGVIVNGLLFSLPRKSLPGDASDALSQKALDAGINRPAYEMPSQPANLTNELTPAPRTQMPSVTEHTTQHLNTSKS